MFDPRLFEGKVVLITGAAGGVGSAAARLLRRSGADLSLTSTHAGRLQALAGELNAQAIVADLAQVANCQRVVDDVLARHGRLDALVNCAGVWTEGDSALVTEQDWDRCVDVNLKATFFLCSHAIPALKATRGAIVNVGSDAGIVGNAGCVVYCASKGGLVLMGKALALELAPFGVRVNTVCPSDIATPMLHRQAELFGGGRPREYLDRLLSRYPQGQEARFIEPEEVASLIAFLLAAPATPITGATLSMDFGVTAGY
ncbi:SDR family oxidoreductase [Aquincola sp. S2]|uniref:SDR family oxidoreductase n=1 Tax=Pseudaquabacterium terrae TaxID=2732868 RepID=A0ABX2EUL4_9BURK|nr:SDR family NAD(P)-dependent oxidoreductase [Aquabacterium terrae]NRF72172.1 SDR family oxidoreductase [Aquabacterium terrae]